MATKTASLSLEGVGDLVVDARRVPNLKLVGEGDFSATATRVRSRSLAVDGVGDLVVAPVRVRSVSVAYQGVGDLTATGHRVRSASVDLDGVGDLSAYARAILVSHARHIHRADGEYALNQHGDVTLPLERTIGGAVYEEGRDRQLGRDEEEEA